MKRYSWRGTLTVPLGFSENSGSILSGPLRLRVQSRSRTRLRIAASIAFLFRTCFKGVLDTIVACAVAIYRMGNRAGAKIRKKWEKKWKMPPGLKWPKNGHRNGKMAPKWDFGHFFSIFFISAAIFRPFQAGGHFPFFSHFFRIFAPDRFPIL